VAAARIADLDAAKITTGTIATARLGSGTASSSNYLRGDQSWQLVSSTSNVIFQWYGLDTATVNEWGLIQTTVSNPTSGTWASPFSLLVATGTTYRTVLVGKFVKIAGISTITINARLWSWDAAANAETILNVDIGGQSNTVKSVTSTTPAWVTTATIDVSGLTNGTTYDIKIQLKNEGGQTNKDSYCGAVVLIAS
jgi:hypothetical protein